jgi:hypothetical protein
LLTVHFSRDEKNNEFRVARAYQKLHVGYTVVDIPGKKRLLKEKFAQLLKHSTFSSLLRFLFLPHRHLVV